MTDVVLATRNPSKIEQIKLIFNGSPLRIVTLDEAGIKGEGNEDGRNLAHNALKKASYAYHLLQDPTWTIADDTGIFIDALGGAPGVHSARWAGNVSTDEITEFTLQKLNGATKRSAKFVTFVNVVRPSGAVNFLCGIISGKILEAPRCKPRPKMPYGPIFVPAGSDKALAQMSLEEELSFSHRGLAFRAARKHLEVAVCEKDT